MINQGKFLIDALKQLLRNQDEWKSVNKPRIKKLLAELESIYVGFDKRTFVQRSNGFQKLPVFNLIHEKKFIYLPPITKDRITLPVMSIKCDLTMEQPQLSLRVMLHFFRKTDSIPSVKAIGYRYETPEESGKNRSRHDYYHSQPIICFDKDHSPSPFCDTDILEKTPAFPLDAKSPATLLMSMLISLYGVNDPTVQEIYRLMIKIVPSEVNSMHTRVK